MSDSELLRIKDKRKASYKSRKTARSNLKKNQHGLMTDWGLSFLNANIVPYIAYLAKAFAKKSI